MSMVKPIEIPISQRLNSIDFARGLVVVIMALDHIRDLLHTTALSHNPLDLSSTTPALFFTRWITHLCAPTFVFLAGTSAYLMMKNQNNLPSTRRFIFTRGLWLIFLEITVVGFGIWCDIRFRTFLFQVIFAIGAGFVILSTLLKLPPRIIGLLGLVIVLFHNALASPAFTHEDPGGGNSSVTWGLLFGGGFFKLGAERALVVGYPIIPWLGIMLLGFGFGTVFELNPTKRRKLFLWSGILALVLFVLLRSINLYGDPKAWSSQSSSVFTFLSFIDVTKYPPSLQYTAITLSLMFFILLLVEGKNSKAISFFVTFGRVPMFFYLLHWYVVHASMFVMLFLQGIGPDQMPFGIMQFGRPQTGVGLGLPFVYLYWAGLILAMYPLCRWYGQYKSANRQKKWLGYL